MSIDIILVCMWIWSSCGLMVWVNILCRDDYGQRPFNDWSPAQRRFVMLLCGPAVWPWGFYGWVARQVAAFWQYLGRKP